jgi:ABC-type transporter Mla maintaining outer membrane lipid asymmetry ATPase subunit MlaF
VRRFGLLTDMSHLLELERVRMDYGGLRPLRLESVRVSPGQRVAITGIDAAGGEVLVGLLTGSILPDEGQIRVFGRDTATIVDPDDWVLLLDRFSVVSVRAGLLDELTVAQNIALTFTLSIDPIAEAVMGDVRRLAVEAGVPLTDLDRPQRDVTAEAQARCHLARAMAADPSVLFLDHANALTTPADAPAFGRDIARVAAARRLAVLAATADGAFAHAVGGSVLAVDPSTGRLTPAPGWRRWFQ